MTDYSSKRIAIRFCTPDVINLIESLPRGYKSMIVETALKNYLDSDIGKKLTDQLKRRTMTLDQLNKRNREHSRVHEQSANKQGTLKNQLNGDF